MASVASPGFLLLNARARFPSHTSFITLRKGGATTLTQKKDFSIAPAGKKIEKQTWSACIHGYLGFIAVCLGQEMQ